MFRSLLVVSVCMSLNVWADGRPVSGPDTSGFSIPLGKDKPLTADKVRKTYAACLNKAAKPLIGYCDRDQYSGGIADQDFEINGGFSFHLSCYTSSGESASSSDLSIYQSTKDAIFNINGRSFRLLGGLPEYKFDDVAIAYKIKGEEKGKVDWNKTLVAGPALKKIREEARVALVWNDAHRQDSKFMFDVRSYVECLNAKLGK